MKLSSVGLSQLIAVKGILAGFAGVALTLVLTLPRVSPILSADATLVLATMLHIAMGLLVAGATLATTALDYWKSEDYILRVARLIVRCFVLFNLASLILSVGFLALIVAVLVVPHIGELRVSWATLAVDAAVTGYWAFVAAHDTWLLLTTPPTYIEQ